jgi:hypothetical protein
MVIEQIVALLVQERDRLETAIHALTGGAKRGRPAKSVEPGRSAFSGGEPKKKRHVSAASRKKMADAQKKRWAALKATK